MRRNGAFTLVRIPYALCAYSLPHSMGYLPTKSGERIAEPITPNSLLDKSVELGLSGVEFPLEARAPVFDGKSVETDGFKGDLAMETRSRGLQLIVDYGALLDYPSDHTVAALHAAARSGATVVRCILSHILCGDRRGLAGGWRAHREALASRLKQLLPVAENLGLSLAVENHQDATSEDLLWLHQETGDSAAFGVTLDTGNPLAVCEDPVEYAGRIAPLIKHVHLKDYTVYFAPEGLRLVRCAAGEGVVDFSAILGIVRANQHYVLPSIEIAAQATRTIPMLEEEWWHYYPAQQLSHLPQALKSIWENCRPAHEPYSSCWEAGGSSQDIAREEWHLVERSVTFFRNLEPN